MTNGTTAHSSTTAKKGAGTDVFPLKTKTDTQGVPGVTITLVVVNSLVFLYQLTLPHQILVKRLLQDWAVVSTRLVQFPRSEWVTLFTSMFLHSGVLHLLGNMLYLGVFGPAVERRIGASAFLFLYLVSGILATLSQIFIFKNDALAMIGASGAIAGVLGAYLVLYTKSKIKTFVVTGVYNKVMDLPAYFFIGHWFLVQALQSVGTITRGATQSDQPGVAWWAHTGGFLAGLVLVFAFRKKSD